jgi:signal transduction histidine kinase/ligand-binding sensor domain-containing protein/DNA-binding response OmpR family regulator
MDGFCGFLTKTIKIMLVMRIQRIYIISIILVSISTFLNSQTLSFSRITSEDGLSNNMVNNILQDEEGFIWIGTREGLNRYDGYSIKVFMTETNDTTSILDNFIISLYKDRNGELWVGTINGVSKYNRDTEDFTRFPTNNAEAESFKKESLGAICEDGEGNIWFGNQDGGVYKLNRQSRKFYYYSYPEKSISALFIDSKKKIYAGTKDCEIYFFDEKAGAFVLADLPECQAGYIPDNYIRNITETQEGNLLMNASHGIFEINPQKGESRKITFIPEGISSFRNNEIKNFLQESPEIMWIGTWGKGLYKYNLRENHLVNFQSEPGESNSLINNDVNIIFKDKGGVLWVGTQEGINIIDPAKDMFRKYQNNPNNPESLHFNFITSFCEDSDGTIWIGTYGAGISKFNPLTKKFYEIIQSKEAKGGLTNNAIRAICEDEQGKVWIGTMKGLDRYNPVNDRFTHFEHSEANDNSISSSDVLCIINGNRNDLWVGTFGGGLSHVKLDGKSPVFENILNDPSDESGISSNYIRSLELDRDGNLWIGSLGSGLDKLNTKTGEIRHLYEINTFQGDADLNRINCIKESNDGLIWIGTWGGLVKLNPLTKKIDIFTVDNGMPDNNISEIQQDEKGNLWVSTFKGIVKMDYIGKEEALFAYYNTRNGLQGNKFNINASLLTKKGELYFGGTTGFNVINPKSIISNEYQPPVVLTNLMIFNEPVSINEKVNGRVILKNALNSSDEITLSYKDRIISIEFAALSFSEKERNTYKYYLEGVDKQWVTVDSKRRFATYSNLPMGRYIFRVKAANSDGVWNEAGTSLNIRVLPPPWKAWYAYLTYAVLIFGGLLLIRNNAIKNANLKHKLQIEAIERQKVEEINQVKFRFFTNISHEVRTPLTLILGPIERLLSQPDLSEYVLDQLYMMNRNGKRLMNLVNQLMDFRKIEMGKLELEYQQDDLFGFLNDIKAAFNELAKEQEIEYNLKSSFKELQIWFDRDKLEMAIYNVLSNAFKFTKSGGRIQISLQSSAKSKGKALLKRLQSSPEVNNTPYAEGMEFAIIQISDSGMGIPKDKLERIFERFYQVSSSFKANQNLNQTGTGIGLSLTREIIQLHQGRILVESQYGKGSKFYIFLPLGDGHIPANQKLKEASQGFSEGADLESVVMSESPEFEYLEIEKKLEQEVDSDNTSVLVVEDNLDIRKYICDSIHGNLKIYEAKDGADGFEAAIKYSPDIIISDIMMPVMDGHEFCKKIKEDLRTSHIPVILLTAYNTLQNHIQGYEEGADEYIAKPFNEKLLNVRILNLINSRKKLREIFSSDLSVSPQKITVTSIDSKFLEKAIKIVEERMDDPEFNVVTFGRELCMSRTNLFRKMKSLTDVSASEFIRSIKIKKAARLLLEGYNVSQVMDKVGISSRSYFNKCFYEQFQKTPSEYVKFYLYSD